MKHVSIINNNNKKITAFMLHWTFATHPRALEIKIRKYFIVSIYVKIEKCLKEVKLHFGHNLLK